MILTCPFFSSGTLPRRDTLRLTEWTHKGKNGKRPARTYTRHPCGHNLENLIRAPSNEMTRLELVSSSALPSHDTLCPIEWTHKRENGKWPARMCTRNRCNHNLENLIRVPSNETTWPELISSGALPRRNALRPLEQTHKGENNKWLAQTCTRHPCGHNLENLIRAPSNETTQPELVSSGALPRRNALRPTERTHKGENGKWPAQTCTRHLCKHNLESLIQAPSNETTWPELILVATIPRRNALRPTEWTHQGKNSKWPTRTLTRHLCGHNLENLIQVPSNETTRPEIVSSGALHPSEWTHKGENGKRPAQTCTWPLCGHNLANLIRVPWNKTNRPELVSLGALPRHDALCLIKWTDKG